MLDEADVQSIADELMAASEAVSKAKVALYEARKAWYLSPADARAFCTARDRDLLAARKAYVKVRDKAIDLGVLAEALSMMPQRSIH